MRQELKNMCGEKHTFTGVVTRIGSRRPYNGSRKNLSTMLLREVRNSKGELVSDHLWLDLVPPFVAVHPSYGAIIQFEGVVESYIRGFSSRKRHYNTGKMSLDFTIKHIDKVSIVGQVEESKLEEMLKWYDEKEDNDTNS